MRFTICLSLLALFACLAPLALPAAPAVQPSLLSFEARVPALRRQIPALVASAEKCADNNIEHPQALVTFPRPRWPISMSAGNCPTPKCPSPSSPTSWPRSAVQFVVGP